LQTAFEQDQDGTAVQNKFEKLVHLDDFIIRICRDARSHERKKAVSVYFSIKVTEHFPRPYKTTGKIIVLYISSFIILEKKSEG
jgi:hypothetical protein